MSTLNARTPEPEPLDALVKRLRGLATRATPGRRRARLAYKKDPPGTLIAAVAPGHHVVIDEGGGTFPGADMDFIAACDPATILRLLDAVEAAEARAEEWKGDAMRLGGNLRAYVEYRIKEKTRDFDTRHNRAKDALAAHDLLDSLTLAAERAAEQARLTEKE